MNRKNKIVLDNKIIKHKLQYQKMMMGERFQENRFCKNHPKNKIQFFIVEQPWIKLCKECALNLALCGKKIDRELTAGQFQNKVVIMGIVEELKKTIQVCEKEGKQMSDFASSVDKIYQDGISCKIKEIDDIIKQLNKIRDSIYRLYEEHISQKINHFYDQQNKYAMDSMTLKKHLENIQINYCDLIIETPNESEQFERHLDTIRADVEKVKKTMLGQSEKKEIVSKIDEISSIFQEKFEELKGKKFIIIEENEERKGSKEEDKGMESQRESLREIQESERKYFSHRKSYKNSENKSILISEKADTNRAKLTLRSNSRKQGNSLFSSKNSTSKKPRESIQDITNLIQGEYL